MPDATPGGDGLVERIVTDVPLWPDVRPEVGPSDAQTRDVPDADGGSTDDAATDGGTGAACDLLVPSCPGIEDCYPFPFAETPGGDARCGVFAAPDAALVVCESQLQCDGASLCATLFGLGTTCRPRCDVASPHCALGMACIELPAYPRVGICL